MTVFIPLWLIRVEVWALLVVAAMGLFVWAASMSYRAFSNGLTFAGLWSDWWRWMMIRRRERNKKAEQD